jgi:protein-histidine pros-kinase
MDMQMQGIEGRKQLRQRCRSWVVSDASAGLYHCNDRNVMSRRGSLPEAGMNDYVSKPLRPDALYAALESNCRKSDSVPECGRDLS